MVAWQERQEEHKIERRKSRVGLEAEGEGFYRLDRLIGFDDKVRFAKSRIWLGPEGQRFNHHDRLIGFEISLDQKYG